MNLFPELKILGTLRIMMSNSRVLVGLEGLQMLLLAGVENCREMHEHRNLDIVNSCFRTVN